MKKIAKMAYFRPPLTTNNPTRSVFRDCLVWLGKMVTKPHLTSISATNLAVLGVRLLQKSC